ncbi:bifunctional diguanylate cyclase/phosphodiesterase [Acidovorax sp. SUPP3434]|uniref:EAL domain-containing protein n=1 Tax=Acidovorax sp. SUPP3434 TaxID=2920880 RepID=UPI0023DE2DB4|nr:EAL domain-containing protein [Acidovorax sp. SUPP3434]GKS99463.1 bifunctional diguanylate cyclase/phosphodiesterase [Acidovorax sp. SUPP3434]
MTPPPHRPVTAAIARTLLSEAPAVTLMLVVAVLALLLVPVVQLLGSGLQGLHGLEPFLDMVVVLIGLLAVAVSLHMLDDTQQGRANVLVAGLATAAVCNFLHAVLLHQMESMASVTRANVSSYFGLLAHGFEALTLLLFALRVSFHGPGRAWAVASAGVSLVLVWSASSGLPEQFGLAHGERFAMGADGLLGGTMAVAAWMMYRVHDTARRERGRGRRRIMACAAAALALAEFAMLLYPLHPVFVDTFAHALRVLGYALMFQAVFIAGIRMPFARAREAEARLLESERRLQLLGRNLPDSVLYQRVREADGRWHFVHMGDAIERLNGISAQAVVNDATLFFEQMEPQDRLACAASDEASYRTMGVGDSVVRMRVANGQLRWMRMSSTPRPLDKGRVIWDGVLTDVTEQREAQDLSRAHEVQLASLLSHLPGGVSRLDRDLRIVYVNPSQAHWLRRPVDELEGQFLVDVLPADLMAPIQPHFDRALEGETVVFEHRIPKTHGAQFWHTTLVPEVAADGRTVAVVVFAFDLTEQKRMALELTQQRTRLASLVSAIPDVVFLKDANGCYLSCNPVFERFIGRRERDIIGLSDDDLLPAVEAQRVRQLDQRAMAAWQPLVYEETLTFQEDGYEGYFETIKTPIRDLHGHVTGLLGVCRDITDRKKAEQQIELLAFFDALTGLPNRRLLLDRLQRASAVCQRNGQLGALLFIDLDNFKDLNDTLGHDMGDQLLAQVATRLVSCVRATDTVARFGGDEFVVMLENLDAGLTEAATQAEHVADKLLLQLNQPFMLGTQQHYSTPSIGITLFGDQPRSVDELLKRADLAMYQAKAEGRNTQRFFDPEMQAQVHARSHLEADLRQGLARQELAVHYQPIVDHRAQLCGAEALVRWHHPGRGMISPGDFIPLAEQTGLILPLGRFVLESACEQLVRWAEHPDTARLTIAVNVSARQFRQPAFAAEVLETLQRTGANPQRLKLELTESLLLGDIEDAIQRMAQLKKQGVGFSLDDFGTGYSSLSYLKRLPLDQVKIDQGFVRDVLTDPNDAAIVRTILALAKSLDLQVVAEGVETTGQLAFLKLHGCEGFQGYLFGRPSPVAQFERDQQLPGALPTAAEAGMA